MRELTNLENEAVQGGSIDAPPLETITFRLPNGEMVTMVVGPIILGF